MITAIRLDCQSPGCASLSRGFSTGAGSFIIYSVAKLSSRTSPESADTQGTRSGWRYKTLPLRYPLFVLVVLLAVMAAQLVEDLLDTPVLEMMPPRVSVPRWTLVFLTFYMLVMLRLIHVTAGQTLRDIKSSVRVDDRTFERFCKGMARLHLRTDLGLALLSLVFVLLLFPVMNSPLPITRNPVTNERTFLPHDSSEAFLVIVGYTLVGWAALSLLVNTVRLGYNLGKLTRLPLAVNIFDTANVLPLGRMALMLSLAPAGILLILLIGLGTPNRLLAWFALLLATLASLLALVLPLRGVHRQLLHAKKTAQSTVNAELSQINTEMFAADQPDVTRMAWLSNRVNILINLRKVIQEAPTWPFRDTVSISRALLVASAPIIYTILNELIRLFVIQPLAK